MGHWGTASKRIHLRFLQERQFSHELRKARIVRNRKGRWQIIYESRYGLRLEHCLYLRLWTFHTGTDDVGDVEGWFSSILSPTPARLMCILFIGTLDLIIERRLIARRSARWRFWLTSAPSFLLLMLNMFARFIGILDRINIERRPSGPLCPLVPSPPDGSSAKFTALQSQL